MTEMPVDYLPSVNALLNAVASVCLILGYLSIRRDRRRLHRNLMITAMLCTTLFLISYLTYHFTAGLTGSGATGTARVLYLVVLWTHMPLAVVTLPLVVITARRGFMERLKAHKRIARWTLPIWLYVSLTGILVYLILYHWFPTGR